MIDTTPSAWTYIGLLKNSLKLRLERILASSSDSIQIPIATKAPAPRIPKAILVLLNSIIFSSLGFIVLVGRGRR